MRLITFTIDQGYVTDNIWLPLRLPGARTPTVVRALVDTGAAITLLNRRYINHLRLPHVRTGTPFAFETATRARATGYIHDVTIEILGRQFQTEVAFVPSEDTINLLGMRGFFDKLLFGLDHRGHSFHVRF